MSRRISFFARRFLDTRTSTIIYYFHRGKGKNSGGEGVERAFYVNMHSIGDLRKVHNDYCCRAA